MPASYTKHDVQFLYPENWTLKDQVDDQLPYQVSLETPTGGLWSLNWFSASEDPEGVLDRAIAALREQFEDVEFAMVDESWEPIPSRGVEAHFFCLDFLVTARIRVFRTANYQLLNWYQAESREFDAQHDVFRAVTHSLLQSVAPGSVAP